MLAFPEDLCRCKICQPVLLCFPAVVLIQGIFLCRGDYKAYSMPCISYMLSWESAAESPFLSVVQSMKIDSQSYDYESQHESWLPCLTLLALYEQKGRFQGLGFQRKRLHHQLVTEPCANSKAIQQISVENLLSFLKRMLYNYLVFDKKAG